MDGGARADGCVVVLRLIARSWHSLHAMAILPALRLPAASDIHTQHVLTSLPRRKVLSAEYPSNAASVGVQVDNVAGVQLPRFIAHVPASGVEGHAELGLSGGGAEIRDAQNTWANILKVVIRLATLQQQFLKLDNAIRLTARRVNALENVRECAWCGVVAHV